MIADAVAVGELLRRAALKKHNVPSETLSGKRPTGAYRLDGHQHAHYLSLTRGQRPGAAAPIDSLVVWAPGRLNGDELAALAQVKWLRSGRSAPGVPDIAVAVAAFGDVGEVAPEIVRPFVPLGFSYSVCPWQARPEALMARTCSSRNRTRTLRVSRSALACICDCARL